MEDLETERSWQGSIKMNLRKMGSKVERETEIRHDRVQWPVLQLPHLP
jgi:hypothetical protein